MKILNLIIVQILFGALVVAAQNSNQAESSKITELKRRLDAGDETAVERFWKEVQIKGAPLVEPIDNDQRHSLVTFLWRGTAATKNVLVVSQLFQWMMTRRQMTNLPGTNVWYKTVRAADDLRATYLISENDPRLAFADPLDWARVKVSPTLDPLNPKKFVFPKDEDVPDSEAFEQSLIVLPAAYKEPFNHRKAGTPTGKLEKHKFASRILGNERRVWVYTPPGYSTEKKYPTIVLFDGWEYLNVFPTPAILDNLQSAGKIPPTVAVFVANPFEANIRDTELSCNPRFAYFVARELMPWVRVRYRIHENPKQTIVGGRSLGGLAAACVAFKHSEIFGSVLAQSGSFAWSPDGYEEDGEWLTHQFVAAKKLPLRFYLEFGKLEIHSQSTRIGRPTSFHANRHLRDVLRIKGNTVFYAEFNGDHSSVNWRENLAGALQKLLGD